MANYPDVTQVVGSQVHANDGTTLERAVNGRARLQSFYNDVQLEFDIIHECDGVDKDAIWNHYLTHRPVAFNFKYHGDAATYSVRYVGPPERVPVSGTDRWRVVTKFVVF